MPKPSLKPMAFGVFLLGTTAGLGCSSDYQAQGQFWPILSSGSGGGSDGQPAGGFPTAGAQGNLAGSSNGSGGSAGTGSGGIDNSLGGSNPSGGSASASAGSTTGGSAENSGGSSTGGSSAGAPGSGGGSSTGGSSAGGPGSGGGGSTGGSSAGGASATGGSGSIGGRPGTGGGSSGGGSSSGGSGGASTSATCSLSVSVTTTAPGGQYAPRNVGAIWVANSSGAFVKSLEVWGNQRLSHVTAWNAATKAAGVAANKVDAITSATLSAHRAHNVTWNCQNYNRQPVADGTYRVYFEVTDSNQSGPSHFESFAKGSTPVTVQGSSTNFNNISLVFKP
jgi:hypothetical protein